MPIFWLLLFTLILAKRKNLYLYLRIACIFIYISLTPIFSILLEFPLVMDINNFEKQEKYSIALVPTAGIYQDFQSKWHPSSKTVQRISMGEKLAKELSNEEFIQEVEDKNDSKAKKVIDIMRGKNSIKINPDVKENTVVVQDASGKDFVEIVDIITPQKVRSDWRKEINVTEASAAWQRKEGKSKSGGLNEKGRKSYERQNPGSDLKAPSKKVGNKRRASFCARMKGMKKKLTSAKTARDPDSRINKSLRAWNC